MNTESASAVSLHVPLALVRENPLQPRNSFSPASLQQLAASIKQQGVVQPIVLRPHPHIRQHYQLVAGERRLRAMRLLGWSNAPALVRQVPDDKLLEIALVENLQREALSPIEEASAYRQLIKSLGCTQEELAQRVGKDRSTVTNMLRLLSLPPLLQEDLETGRLSQGHARALLSLPHPEQQLALRNLVLQGKLSVRETERLVERERQHTAPPANNNTADNNTANSTSAAQLSPLLLHYQAAEKNLERRFGTKVRILPPGTATVKTPRGKNSTGEIRLSFHSEKDFNRLYQLFHQHP